MITLNEYELLELLKEDLPYNDLTTDSLDICGKKAVLSLSTRKNPIVLSGINEIQTLCKMFHLDINQTSKTGEIVESNSEFFRATGDICTIAKIVKTIQNILDFSSGVATYTHNLLAKAKEKNKDIIVATTRKTIPFTKKLSISSVLAAGATIHRYNLSESILLFDHHLAFIDAKDAISKAKAKNKEKKVAIEAHTTQEALMYCSYNADIIQLEKFKPIELDRCAKEIKRLYPHITIIATGGINLGNIDSFILDNIDVIVTTSVYFAPPADIKVKIEPI